MKLLREPKKLRKRSRAYWREYYDRVRREKLGHAKRGCKCQAQSRGALTWNPVSA